MVSVPNRSISRLIFFEFNSPSFTDILLCTVTVNLKLLNVVCIGVFPPLFGRQSDGKHVSWDTFDCLPCCQFFSADGEIFFTGLFRMSRNINHVGGAMLELYLLSCGRRV
jgi:hypothetical protein